MDQVGWPDPSHNGPHMPIQTGPIDLGSIWATIFLAWPSKNVSLDGPTQIPTSKDCEGLINIVGTKGF